MRWLLLLSKAFSLFLLSYGNKPQPGRYFLTLPRDQSVIQTGLYQNSSIYMTLRPNSCNSTNNFSSLCWTIQGMDCMAELSQEAKFLTQQPWTNLFNHTGMYVSNCNMKDFSDDSVPVHCSDNNLQVTYYDGSKWEYIDEDKRKRRDADHESPPSVSNNNSTETKAEVVPVKMPENPPSGVAEDNTPSEPNPPVQTSKLAGQGKPESEKGLITRIPMDGYYHIVVELKQKGIEVDVLLEIKNPFGGYLLALDYPFLNFYMAMCILYACYAAAWLTMSACNKNSLMQVHYWIGAAILLGIIEKSVFYAEYKNINDKGVLNVGAAMFADTISAFKRAFARMLVLILSTGFDTFKLSLTTLYQIIASGVIFFAAAVIDAVFSFNGLSTGVFQFTFVPIAIIDSFIGWLILINLKKTINSLKSQENSAKLRIYRIFSATLVICVLVSVINVIWEYLSRSEICMVNWKYLWIQTALWQVLFSIILLVSMILWRPIESSYMLVIKENL